MNEIDLNLVRGQAKKEIHDERFRALVDAEKQRLRKARWWHRFIPIITITWRKP